MTRSMLFYPKKKPKPVQCLFSLVFCDARATRGSRLRRLPLFVCALPRGFFEQKRDCSQSITGCSLPVRRVERGDEESERRGFGKKIKLD